MQLTPLKRVAHQVLLIPMENVYVNSWQHCRALALKKRSTAISAVWIAAPR